VCGAVERRDCCWAFDRVVVGPSEVPWVFAAPFHVRSDTMHDQQIKADASHSQATPSAPSANPNGEFKAQLKQSDFAEGSALLMPVQAKGGITIGAHKGAAAAPGKGAPGKGAPGKGSGITIGAHKGGAAGAPGQAPGGKGPAQAPGAGPSGVTIGAHKAAPGGAGAGAATGPAAASMAGPPHKPLPVPPGGAGPSGAMAGPPHKPLPVPPQQPPPGAAAAPDEQQLEDEDRGAFADVDGNILLFDNEALVDTYFNVTTPRNWMGAHPMDHAAIHRRATQDLHISDPELFSLIGYTGPGYAPMNRLTRGQMKSKRFTSIFRRRCDQAATALKKLDNKQEKQTQRGWRNIPKGDDTIITGLYEREFVDERGFMSTTANSDQSFFAGPVSIQITGKSGVDIQQLSVLPSEGEVLYPPNTHFKVRSFVRDPSVEPAWRAWHRDNTNPKPDRPWFVVDLEEQ
jgi:hypothetical protein